MKIPNGHQVVMPYLIVNNASDFIDFTKSVFGSEVIFQKMRDENTIMHAEIQIGGSTIMFADATEQFKPQTANLFVYVADADEIYHKSLSEGATSIMELSDQDYGRTCGIKDAFDNVWYITSVTD